MNKQHFTKYSDLTLDLYYFLSKDKNIGVLIFFVFVLRCAMRCLEGGPLVCVLRCCCFETGLGEVPADLEASWHPAFANLTAYFPPR